MRLKSAIMSIAEIKKEIDIYHQKVEDERFLKVVHSMLTTYLKESENPTIGYETDGTPVSISELFEQSDQVMNEGKGISVEELEKRADQWLSRNTK